MNELLNIYDEGIKNKKDVSRETIIKIAEGMNIETLVRALEVSRREFPSLTDTLGEVFNRRMETMNDKQFHNLSVLVMSQVGEVPSPTPPLEGKTALQAWETWKGKGGENGAGDNPAPKVYTNHTMPVWFFFVCSTVGGSVIGALLTYLFLELVK